jgi:NAD(P)H-quinone oxidoreductase subunit 4L
MWSKSSTLVVLFVFVATVLVGAFSVHLVDAPLKAIGDSIANMAGSGPGLPRLLQGIGLSLGTDFDLWTAFIIVVVGLVAYVIGADLAPLLIMGSLAVFFVLTLQQDSLTRYLTLAAMLFSVGVYGMTTSRNAVRVLMCIELMLNAVNINMVAFARYIDPSELRGQIFAIFILTVAAAEAAVGLAIVLAMYRTAATVNMEKFNLLKW